MARAPKTPAELARRLGAGRGSSAGEERDSWRRETFRLPRPEARRTARDGRQSAMPHAEHVVSAALATLEGGI